MTQSLDAEDIAAAYERIADSVRRTRIIRLPDAQVWLKLESTQVTGSFKIRGALNAALLSEAEHLVTGSSGNHGLALCGAAALTGKRCTVFMTRNSDPAKRKRVQRESGVVILCPDGNHLRDRRAAKYAEEVGATFVSSHDDGAVIAGQGTVGLEILEQMPTVTDIFVPVGGGGLLAGIALAVRSAARSVRVIGVEPAGGDAFARSIVAGRRVDVGAAAARTICDGARAPMPGSLPYDICRNAVDRIVAVPDSLTVAALRRLRADGVPAEPTGALALAGFLSLAASVGGRTPVVIVSGANAYTERGYGGDPMDPATPAVILSSGAED